MKVERMKWITREIVRANRDKAFLFGDNLSRKGYGGQAKEMRGEPNAYGIRVKIEPARRSDSFFSDDSYETNCRLIQRDIDDMLFMAKRYHPTIVIPSDGIGTGLAQLDKRAPKTFAYLQQRLAALENTDNEK